MEKEYFVLYTPDEMNLAYNLLKKEFDRSEIFEVLSSENDIEKQVCLIVLKTLETLEDAEKLVSCLTGQHGPVREICSAKINEFLKNEKYRRFFAGSKTREILLNGLNDIIPTVARNISDVISFLPEQNEVKNALMQRILDLDVMPEEVDVITNHEIIKKTFKLYWYLGALAEIADGCECDIKFINIIENTYSHEDYTIREKVAKILARVSGFENIKKILKNDDNPYVFSNLQ